MNRLAFFISASNLFVILIGAATTWVHADDPEGIRPSAMVSGVEDDELLIADLNRGHVLRVHLDNNPVVAELEVGESLVDLAWTADEQVIAIDQNLAQLIGFTINDGHPRISKRISLDVDPRRLSVSPNCRFACVTGRWSKSVQVIAWSERNKLIRKRAIRLGFEAQEILALPNQRFLAADAFGGQLAVIDAVANRLVTTKQLHGHNVRGLALTLDGSRVLIAHQVLSRMARSDFDDIHWGSLMQNVVSVAPLDALLDPSSTFTALPIRVGDVGNGSADPTDLVAMPGGFAVLSGGARQVIFFRDGKIVRRVPTGSRPTRIIGLGGDRLVVLNEHDGSVTMISTESEELPQTIAITSAKPVSEGERAFYDASLSHDSWMTCNSCHVDGHSPGLTADTFGDGEYGNPKRIPGLMGATQTQPFGWLGNMPGLADQITSTLHSTMHGQDIDDSVTDDLVRFVEGLSPAPSMEKVNQSIVQPGYRVFQKLNCKECHTPPRYTSPRVQDVGLQDERGNRSFNPPSLRGLRHRRAFFHDARAKSLRSVFQKYHHPIPQGLSDKELDQLLAYLNSL